MTTHNWWSPSAAQRNIACHASVQLNQKRTQSSKYADQGSVCHIACDSTDKNGSHGVVFTEDWQEQAVKDALQQREELIARCGFVNYQQNNETKVDLGAYGFADVFGTADIIIYDHDSKTLMVMDYKFGAGVAVSPNENPQLMTYAVGALSTYQHTEKVVLVVIQPRLYNEALTWDTTPGSLVEWRDDTLLPAIKASREPNAEFNPGEAQCRWCEAANKGCPAQLQQLKSLLPEQGETMSETVSNQDLAEFLKKIPAYEQAIKQVKATAHSRMMEGQTVDGFKLVRASKNRIWDDPIKADNLLKRKKFKMDERYSMKLISPSQAEKALAAKGAMTPRLITTLKNYIRKPVGDPVVAPASDKREEFTPINPIDELPPASISVEDLL